MRKFLSIFCILFLNYFGIAQNSLEFQPLRVIDTIRSQKELKNTKGLDKVNDTFFFVTEYSKKREGLFLIEKKGKYWIVYDYNDFVSNYVVSKHNYLNSSYISITVSASRSGFGINEYSWYILFDLKNKLYLTLDKSSYNADEKNIVLNKCESIIKFKKNIFTIKRNCFPKNECGNCVESGKYKVVNGKLKKTKPSR